MEPPGQVQSSIDLGGYCPPGSTRKRQVRFAAHHDILLLREVIHHNPFAVRESGRVWAAVAEEMNSALRGEGFEVDGRRCRERTALLLHYYKRQNFTGLRSVKLTARDPDLGTSRRLFIRDEIATLENNYFIGKVYKVCLVCKHTVCGTESLYIEKEDLLQEVLELESEKQVAGSEPRHRYTPQDTMAVTVTEETLCRVQEEVPVPTVMETKQEDDIIEERTVRKTECEGCCSAYARVLQHLERRAEAEQRLREEELSLRREELQLQRERAALERERQEAERRERERRFELEREERQIILDILREKMMK